MAEPFSFVKTTSCAELTVQKYKKISITNRLFLFFFEKISQNGADLEKNL